MKISILVPVFNEETTIKTVLEKLLLLKLPCPYEIIVIDDGSSDKTSIFLNEIKKKNKFGLIINRHKLNQGKGKAIQTGIKYATGDYILIQDADLEYNPLEIKKLLRPILAGKKKKFPLIAVYGSRFRSFKPSISPLYHLGNKSLTFLTNILYSVNLTDMETGYKLIPANFLKSAKLVSVGFDIEPEITAKLIKAGIPIREVAITYKGRSHLTGKKLTISDAFAAIKALISLKFINSGKVKIN